VNSTMHLLLDTTLGGLHARLCHAFLVLIMKFPYAMSDDMHNSKPASLTKMKLNLHRPTKHHFISETRHS